ncbi:50S ribosomal protein L29 [Candidatus Micrarchaeota archaeon]|nr:50S ribosomal protein L29 [Candidatus Micrarchaeota archaeon]
MKKFVELKALTTEQLVKRLKDVENELLFERSKKGSGGRAFNPGKIRNLKKIKARIKTILNEQK